MTPYKKQILFKPFPPEEKTVAGLFVPESFQEMNNRGMVMEVGHMVTRVKKGDVVYKVKSNGETDWCHELIIDGERHYLINENTILALE